MTRTARGTFSVDMTVRPPDPDTDPLGQMRIAKTWTGDVAGTGHGLMVSGGDPVAGTAGYVAMEVVQGRIEGREGSFALQQLGTMRDGDVHQVYEVVPGSGTDELAGLAGTLALELTEGVHHYSLTYDLPPGV